jgi:glycosyltransferase involved in cell wall biosynthesis
MFVLNDCTTDARVLREAGSLAAVGHEVTVMARPRDPMSTVGEVEQRDGFEIRRVPIPHAWRLTWTFVRYPWRMRSWVVGRTHRGLRTLPTGFADIVLGVGVGLAAIGWSIVRAPLHLAGRALGRTPPAGAGLVDWLVRWRWATLGWANAAAAAAPTADVYHGHDLSGLPAALAAAARPDRGGRVVYDSHEIFLESGSNATRPAWARAWFARLERGWVARSDALVTVNDALAADLTRRYRPRRTVVVHNCPPRWNPSTGSEDALRSAAGVDAGTPIALYHGGFSTQRGLPEFAASILEPGLEGIHAVFLGYGRQSETLERLAAEPRFDGRVHVLDPVQPDALVTFISTADVGVMPIQPSTLNHILSTPNKLFECLAAGVPVVVSDLPEMRRIVLDDPDGPLGTVCDPSSPPSIAHAIQAILGRTASEAADLRARCLRAAHARWNWETEVARLLALYDDLLGPVVR